jgi:hypothetical protein
MASDKTPLLESSREKSVDVSSAPLPTPPATTQSSININLNKAKSNKALEMTILTAAMECNPWQYAPSSRRVRYDEVSKALLVKGISATHHQIQVVVDKKLIQYYKYRSDPGNNSSYLANKPREFLPVMTKIAGYFSQLEMRRTKAKSDASKSAQHEDSHNNDNFIDLSDSTAPSSPVIVEPTVPSRRRRSVHMEYKPQSSSEFIVSSQSHPSAPHQPIPPPLYPHSQAPPEHFSSHKPNPFHDQPNPFTSNTPLWPPGYSSSNGQPPQANTHHPIQPRPLSHKSTPHPPNPLSNPPSVPSMPSRSQANSNCCSHDCHKIQSKLFTPLKEFLEKKLEWDHAKLERENWRYEKQLEIENQQRARQIEIDREIRLREIEQRAMEVQLDRQVMDKFFKMMNEFMDQFNQNHEHSPRSQVLPPPQPMMAPPAGSRAVVVPGPNAPMQNPHAQPPHQPLLHTNKIKLAGHKPAPISVPPPPTHPSQLPHPSSHSHSSHSHHQSR